MSELLSSRRRCSAPILPYHGPDAARASFADATKIKTLKTLSTIREPIRKIKNKIKKDKSDNIEELSESSKNVAVNSRSEHENLDVEFESNVVVDPKHQENSNQNFNQYHHLQNHPQNFQQNYYTDQTRFASPDNSNIFLENYNLDHNLLSVKNSMFSDENQFHSLYGNSLINGGQSVFGHQSINGNQSLQGYIDIDRGQVGDNVNIDTQARAGEMVGQRKKRYYDGQAKTDSEDNSIGDLDMDDLDERHKLGMTGYFNSSSTGNSDEDGSKGSQNIYGGDFGGSDDDGSD